MRLRTLAAACLAGVALVTSVQLPAVAVDYTEPVITSVAENDVVTGSQPLTATSTKPYVLFQVFDGAMYSAPSVSAVVPVAANGEATYDWPTWGFGDHVEVAAFDCTGSSQTTCFGSGSNKVTVAVDNTVDGFAAPTEPVYTDPDVDGPTTVTVTDDNPGGTVHVLWNGKQLAMPAQVNAPTALTFGDVDAGVGTLQVWRCSSLDARICSYASAPSAEVTMRRRLSPSVTILGSTAISPDGQGEGETASGSVWLDPEITTGATWTVTDAGGTPLAEPQPITIAPNQFGRSAFAVDPRGAGLDLPEGSYRVRVDATGAEHGYDFTGTTSTPFTVDLTPMRVTSLKPSLGTFYPYREGYKDTVTVTPTVVGDGGFFDVQVVSSAGGVVRTIRAANLRNGGAFDWDGTNDAGKQVLAGVYEFRATLTDPAGNVDTFQGGAVTVSSKRLVSKTFVKTVSARTALLRDDSGRCSSLRIPGLRGWAGSVGYYSQSRCKGTSGNASRIAAGLHGVRLPAAYQYGTVNVSAYGGATRLSTGSQAVLFWWKANGQDSFSSDKVLTPGVKWHPGGGQRATAMMDPDRWVYWSVLVGNGLRYDIAKFKVTMPYVVLQ